MHACDLTFCCSSGPWKRKNLTEFGIVTQCIGPPTKISDQYFTNLLMKINSKVSSEIIFSMFLMFLSRTKLSYLITAGCFSSRSWGASILCYRWSFRIQALLFPRFRPSSLGWTFHMVHLANLISHQLPQ